MSNLDELHRSSFFGFDSGIFGEDDLGETEFDGFIEAFLES